MNIVKKSVSYVLITIILVFTIVALLGIWEIIDFEQVMVKLIYSLIVIFAASSVILFIFSVLIKEDNDKEKK